MSDKTPTIPPVADPVLAAFEALSAKMETFTTTLHACHTLLVEQRAWMIQTDERLAALESIPPPSHQGANGAVG